MCGIVGIVCKEGGIQPALVKAMRDRMFHRGPNDAGLFLSEGGIVALGHRRLSIIDLSSNGHQPMSNEDQMIWLVFNGEIYNFQQLRHQLVEAGHRFRSNTDSEVIIHAYEEWGLAAVKRLRGMFAYALWDSKLQRLVLARDRVGIKPLVYWHDRGSLCFASELRALRANNAIALKLDETAIYDFFTYRYIPSPKTIYQGIKKLPPGHYAVFEHDRLSLTQYWDLKFTGSGTIDETEAIERIRSRLTESIDLHLVADVPVGVMLSGGLDSSTVSALAARSVSGPLHTFSIGFDVAQHDETRYARLVANQYRTNHHELRVTREMGMASEKDIVSLYDEPFADSSAIPTFFVSELARKNVTVALSGEGGDELFGGYNWYTKALQLSKMDIVPLALRQAANRALRATNFGFKGRWTLHAATLDPIERYTLLMSGFLREEKQALLAQGFSQQFDGYDDYWHFRKYWREDLDPLSRMQYLDVKTYLNDDILTKVDRASMAVSLEARVPLLDHELIETVLELPVNTRNRGGEQKYLFKKVVDDLLPREIINREKRGFSVPLYEWLKAPNLRELEPIYDNRFVASDSIKRRAVAGGDLWPFLVLGRWLHGNT